MCHRVRIVSSSFGSALGDLAGLAMAKMWSYDPDEDFGSFALDGAGLGDGLILPDKPKVPFVPKMTEYGVQYVLLNYVCTF